MMGDIAESIKVFIRQRPLLFSESSGSIASNDSSFILNDENKNPQQSGISKVFHNETACSYFSSSNKTNHKFKFDRLFSPASHQEELYNTIARPIVDSALLGYSGTILAYGPTSSGKTHTMRGGEDDKRGIMPRCIEHLLAARSRDSNGAIEEDSVEIWASYLQIYCESVTDLLLAQYQQTPQPLSIREKADGEVYVDGLTKCRVSAVDDLWALLRTGDENRSTAATNMNETSSRSHAVLVVTVITKENSAAGDSSNPTDSTADSNSKKQSILHRQSTLMLVDLAGSERASASDGKEYQRLEEAKAINLSLSALGNCMSALAEASTGGGGKHVPYRDSKLTRLLQSSLGGKCRTALVVNIPPFTSSGNSGGSAAAAARAGKALGAATTELLSVGPSVASTAMPASSGVDGTGEILQALRFASRASKIKVVAKISRCKDYESLYKEAKRKLDMMEVNDGSVACERLKAVHKEELFKQNLIIDQQALEIDSLKEQIAFLKSQGAGGVGTGGGSATTGGAAANSLLNSALDAEHDNDANYWKQKLGAVAAEHLSSIESISETFKRKIKQMKLEMNNSSLEISDLQADLKMERQRHLDTVSDMRKLQEKKMQNEQLARSRIEELLGEVTVHRSTLEDMQESLVALTQRANATEQELQAAHTKMKVEMVPVSKVKEMEALFLETVSKLTLRVKNLEQSSPHRSGGDGIAEGYGRDNNSNTFGGSTRRPSLGGGGADSSTLGVSRGITRSSSSEATSRLNHGGTGSSRVGGAGSSTASGGGVVRSSASLSALHGPGLPGNAGGGVNSSSNSGRIEPGGRIRTNNHGSNKCFIKSDFL